MLIPMSAEEVLVLQCWFAVNDSLSLKDVENNYKEGLFTRLSSLSKRYLKQQYGESVLLYRWESGKRVDAVLQSWTLYPGVALEYKALRKEGSLVKKRFPIENIVLSTEALLEAGYELDEILGLMPMDEVVVSV